MSPHARRLVMALALATTAGASLRAVARPRDRTERRLIDWDGVRRTALRRAGPNEEMDAVGLGQRYDEMSAALTPLMADVCGGVLAEFPSFLVIDRRGFVEANVEIIRRIIEPAERLRAQIPDSHLTTGTRHLLDRYVGELLGFMSRRVLGQYDPVLMPGPVADPSTASGRGGVTADSSSLYLVEPNIRAFEEAVHAPPDGLRRWIVLHELTHAWQFETHPWLGPHLSALMGEVMMEGWTTEPGDRHGQRSLPPLHRLPETVRAQRRCIGRIQAVMSVLEGHGNFVMHRVGRDHLDDFERIEAAFRKRRQQRTSLERLVLGVTGVNVKLRQYAVGEKFAETVARTAGIETLNRVWEGPQLMPSPVELRQPERWMTRVS